MAAPGLACSAPGCQSTGPRAAPLAPEPGFLVRCADEPRPHLRGARRRLPRPRRDHRPDATPHLRDARRARPSPGERAARARPRVPARTQRAPEPRVGSGPRRALPAEFAGIPRGHARLSCGAGRAVQRQLSLRRRRAPLSPRGRRRGRARLSRALRIDARAHPRPPAAPAAPSAGRRRLRRTAPARRARLRGGARRGVARTARRRVLA